VGRSLGTSDSGFTEDGLYTMKFDCSDEQCLGKGEFDSPMFSPDGERIVFLRDYGLYSMRKDGTELKCLSGSLHIEQTMPYFHSFTPDGKSVLFIAAPVTIDEIQQALEKKIRPNR
jgi:hypothetical protein